MEEGSQEAGAARGRNGSSADPIAQAELLFARLTEGGDIRRTRTPFLPASDGDPLRVSPQETGAAADEVPLPTPADAEVHDLVRAALAATDRIAEAVEVVGSQVDSTSTDLSDFGQAVQQALEATNERLAAVERALHDQATPDPEPAALAQRAMGRLRLTLGRVAKSGAGPAPS